MTPTMSRKNCGGPRSTIHLICLEIRVQRTPPNTIRFRTVLGSGESCNASTPSRDRNKLEPKDHIQWLVRLGLGRHVGVLKIDEISPLKWFARHYARGRKPPQVQRALGDFAHLDRAGRYSAAIKAANTWFDEVAISGQTRSPTVEQACQKYLASALASRKQESNQDLEGHARRLVYRDEMEIKSVTLDKLDKAAVSAWRARIESRPIVSQKKGGKAKKSRQRTPSTINRELGFVAAVLNHAGVKPDVWKAALKPIEKADRSRETLLSREQRAALIAELPADLAEFVRALTLLPLRPGAAAAVEVRDFNPNRAELYIRKDKAGAGRTIALPASTVAYLAAQAEGRKRTDPLFPRADGAMMTKDYWKDPIREAIARAELPQEAVLYCIRHSVIDDLRTKGVDLFTVAKIAGTSVRMIEKFYAKERQADAAAALEMLT